MDEKQSETLTINLTEGDEAEHEWTHPLDRKELSSFFEKNLPQQVAKRLLEDSPRPILSPTPNEREKAIAQRIKERREGIKSADDFVIEETGSWALRTLYEESFAVSPEATLGGTLSHHYREEAEDMTHRLQDYDEEIIHLPIEETLDKIGILIESNKMSPEDALNLLNQIGSLGIPRNVWGKTFFIAERALKEIYNRNPRAVLAGILKAPLERGWLFLRAYSAYREELLAPCEDEMLIRELELDKDTSKIQALNKTWRAIGKTKDGLVLKEDASFKKSGEKGFPEGLRKLAILRSSPDFAFLFKHISTLSAVRNLLPPEETPSPKTTPQGI